MESWSSCLWECEVTVSWWDMKAAALQSCESSEKAKRERYFAQPSCLIFFKEKCAPNRVEHSAIVKKDPINSCFSQLRQIITQCPKTNLSHLFRWDQYISTGELRLHKAQEKKHWTPLMQHGVQQKLFFLILLSLGGVWHSKILKTHGHTRVKVDALIPVWSAYWLWGHVIVSENISFFSVWFQGLRSAHACTHPLSRDREETADKSHKPKVLNSL